MHVYVYCHSERGTLLAAYDFHGRDARKHAARWADLYADCGAVIIVEE